LCLTCSQPEPTVARLVTQLSTPLAELGIQLDTRPYCPHITLARHIRELSTVDFQPVIWSASQFALVESVSSPTGVIYQPLQFWQLTN
jgi:2'-5' RNA ligase